MKISSVFKEGLQRPSVCSHLRGVVLLSLALLLLKGCSSSRLSFCCPFSELMHWFCRQRKRHFQYSEAKMLPAAWGDLLYIPGRRCKSSFILGMQHPVPSTSCTPAQGRKGDRERTFCFYFFLQFLFFKMKMPKEWKYLSFDSRGMGIFLNF